MAHEQDAHNQGGKTRAEERVERFTWFLLVLVFALIRTTPEGTFANWFVPFSGTVILLGSGIFQTRHRWRVSPATWIAAILMLFFALTNIIIDPETDFLGPSLLIFALVILSGIVTGET